MKTPSKKFSQCETERFLKACEKGDVRTIGKFLDAGHNPDVHGENGMRPLHWAAYGNHIPAARLLLQAGADINARTGFGGIDRALEEAVEKGYLAMVKFLIGQGAEINLGGACRALTIAADKGHRELIDLLLKKRAGFEPRLLKAVIELGDTRLVERLIKAGSKVSGNSEREQGIVAAAARSPQGADMVKLVGRYGADLISPLNYEGQTALHTAAHEATALFLINNGADIHAATTGGYTSLHRCAAKGFVQACKRLLELGADPRAKAQNGDTPRVHAKLRNQQGTYNLLTEALKQPKAAKPKKQIKSAAKKKLAKGLATQGRQFAVKKPTWKCPAKPASTFVELVENSFPEFAIIAVRAPFSDIVEKGKIVWPQDGWHRKADIKAVDDSDSQFSTVGLIEIRDNPWTMVLVSIWSNDATRMVDWATKLSKELRTTAVGFCEGDGGYQISVHWLGELQECITWCGGEIDHFKSSYRKRPKVPKEDGKIADQLIGEHGIYFAPCYPCELDTKRLGLAISPETKQLIVRADLLEPGRLR